MHNNWGGRIANLIPPFTDVSDKGLEHLAGLSNMEELYLNGTNVTDSGIEHIVRLKSLKHLDISGTGVTDEGLKALQQKLAKCNIDR